MIKISIKCLQYEIKSLNLHSKKITSHLMCDLNLFSLTKDIIIYLNIEHKHKLLTSKK